LKNADDSRRRRSLSTDWTSHSRAMSG
jgi:hypothetical protein